MNVLDLFSGIGAFALGLQRAGMRPVAFCEIDPFCRRVLAKHWPDVPCHHDIRTLVGAGPVDGICGGFPCQPFSTASRGRRTAVNLWPEMEREHNAKKPHERKPAGMNPRPAGDSLSFILQHRSGEE